LPLPHNKHCHREKDKTMFAARRIAQLGTNRAFGTTTLAAASAGRITTVIGAVVDVQVS